MRLTVVGCAGSYPSAESPASCYLLQAEHEGRTFSLVMDLGNGSFGALQRYVAPDAIDAVVLSHLHVDHCIDLCSYYVVRAYHPDGAMAPIPVWGPTGTDQRMARAYDLPLDPGMRHEFDFRTWSTGRAVEIGPFTVTPTLVDHPVEAFGLRVEADGAVVAYSGDTGPTDALLDIARDADLFVCEASFVTGPDNPPHLHLTGAEAGATATDAGARRLLLTHVPAWTDRDVVRTEAAGAYDGPLDLAVPGHVVELTGH